MNGDYHMAELKQIIGALQIYSPTQYSIQGVMRDINKMQTIFPAQTGQGYDFPDSLQLNNEKNVYLNLIQYIEHDIYSIFYHRPSLGSAIKNFPVFNDFIAALSKANNGSGTWEPGWRIQAIEDDGRIIVSKDEVNYWVEQAGLFTTTGDIRPGDFCRVRIGKEMRCLYPGFYMAVGNSNAPETLGPLLRLYWNLTPAGAVRYVKLVTEQLNELQIPFRTKVISDPGLYLRADAGVLYVEKIYFPQIRKLIRDIHHQIKTDLKPDVPMFTKPLDQGLGLAEDPGKGFSFGLSRCRIVARGLWLGYIQGQTDPGIRLSTLVSSFQAEGLNPKLPYLEKGSADIYSLSSHDEALSLNI